MQRNERSNVKEILILSGTYKSAIYMLFCAKDIIQVVAFSDVDKCVLIMTIIPSQLIIESRYRVEAHETFIEG